MEMDASRRNIRNWTTGILAAVQLASDPQFLVERNLQLDGSILLAGPFQLPLNSEGQLLACAVGKSAEQMMAGLLVAVGDRLDAGFIVAKDLSGLLAGNPKLAMLIGNHPVPGENSLQAARELERFLDKAGPADGVVFLISGGGSALVAAPPPGITLEALQQVTQLLLRGGVTIGEMNTLRRHLDRLKGGGLLRSVALSRTVTLVCSDVVGNDLAAVSSGLSLPDPTTFADCLAILEKYHLVEKVPLEVRSHLAAGAAGEIPETIKPEEVKGRFGAHLLAGLDTPLKAAVAAAGRSGARVYTSPVALEKNIDLEYTRLWDELNEQVLTQGAGEAAAFWAGEVTVERRGNRPGGRCLQLALLIAKAIDGREGLSGFTYATDGEDGSTDAAGTIVDATSAQRGRQHGLSIEQAIAEQDGYAFFDRLGDILRTGPTGANFNDLVGIHKES